jgi:hypothetical protein
MSKKKHKKNTAKKAHKNTKTSFAVECDLVEGAEGSWFEDMVKENIKHIAEIGKEGWPIKITYPINGRTHLIEYDDKDKFSMAGCAWLTLQLLDRGCRIFSSKNRFFVNTSMTKNELKEVMNELMPRLTLDPMFWDMLKCYEEYQKSPW